MASRSVFSRKNSIPQAQRFAYIAELVDAYFNSVQKVQCTLSNIFKTFNQKKILSHELCISFLNALKDMSKPLLTLRSAFEELTFLPEALVSFHVDVFMALSSIQNQAKQVEAHIKRYYQYSISSKLQDMFELTPVILHLTKLFRTQLNKVDFLLKKALGRKDDQPQNTSSVAGNRGDASRQTPAHSVTTVPDSSPNERVVLNPKEASEILSNYKSALNQYHKNLSKIEARKAKFTDPRNVPLDLVEQEEYIQKEMQRLISKIVILEQTDRGEAF